MADFRVQEDGRTYYCEDYACSIQCPEGWQAHPKSQKDSRDAMVIFTGPDMAAINLVVGPTYGICESIEEIEIYSERALKLHNVKSRKRIIVKGIPALEFLYSYFGAETKKVTFARYGTEFLITCTSVKAELFPVFESIFDSCIESFYLDELLHRARESLKMGLKATDLNEKLFYFGKAIEIKPDFFEAFAARADEFVSIGDYESALQDYEKALSEFEVGSKSFGQEGVEEEVSPERVTYISYLWHNRAYTFHKLGREEEAVHCYEISLKISPDFAEGWYNLGNSFLLLGMYNDALIANNKVIKLNPKDMRAWINIGSCLDFLDQPKVALSIYDKALKIDPEFPMAWSNKADVLYELRNYDEALQHYYRAVKIKPDYVKSWYKLSCVLSELGRNKDADEAYQRVLELKPDFDPSKYKGAFISE